MQKSLLLRTPHEGRSMKWELRAESRADAGKKNVILRLSIFLALLVLIFLFTPFTIVRYLALFYFLIRLLPFIYTFLVKKAIVVTKTDEVIRVNRHQSFRIKLLIRNRSFFPVHFIHISDNLGGLFSHESGRFFIGLKAFEEKEVSYDAESHKRGRYVVGPVLVSGSDPLGFFKWEKVINTMQNVITYPLVYPIALLVQKGLPAGNIKVADKLYEDITRFRSVREYTEGDDLKRINWKISARMGKLFSMEYLPALYFPVLILLNLTENDYPHRYRQNLIERALEVTASLIYYTVGLKQEIGLIASGRLPGNEKLPAAEMKAGYGHAQNLLEILAVISPSTDKTDFTQLLYSSGFSIPTGTRLMVISPALKENQSDYLLIAKKRNLDIEVFLISSATQKTESETLKGLKYHEVREYGENIV